MHAVAWITVVAALPTTPSCCSRPASPRRSCFYLIALGVATVWLAYAQGWTLIRWPAALAADLAVAGVTFRALTPGNSQAFRVVLLLQVTLVAAYLGSIAVRTLLRERNVTLFEVMQTVVALVVGFGGAVLLTRSTGTVPVLMGLASLVFGAACYGVAFRFVGRHADHERNVYFYTSLALVLVLAGLALDLPGPWLGAVSASFAVLANWAWSRYGRPDLLVHGAAYIVAAASCPPARWTMPPRRSSRVRSAGRCPASSWSPCNRRGDCGVLRGRAAVPRGRGDRQRDQMRGCTGARVGRQWLAGRLSRVASVARSADGAWTSGFSPRSAPLCLPWRRCWSPWFRGAHGFREWAWLVYPLLVLIGLKMVAQDFKYSRPATLFIALAIYGAGAHRRAAPAARDRCSCGSPRCDCVNPRDRRMTEKHSIGEDLPASWPSCTGGAHALRCTSTNVHLPSPGVSRASHVRRSAPRPAWSRTDLTEGRDER